MFLKLISIHVNLVANETKLPLLKEFSQNKMHCCPAIRVLKKNEATKAYKCNL